jgi:hypothetical protein
MISKADAIMIANKLGVKFNKFSFGDFLTGLNIELEHGKVNPQTNVTNDNLEETAKIALAHLNEFPNYYNSTYGLPKFEEFLKSKL